jgi:RNA methyltransferase, TrmH family
MPIRIVQSKQNARLKELRKALANPSREGRGLVGIEGPNLLKEAVCAGLRIDCVFAAQGTDAMREVLTLPPETEILAMPKELLDSVLATEAPQSIAALVEPPDWTWAHIVGVHVRGGKEKSPALVVVLESLQDPGNLGTILRSAEAFGADGVICLPGTVNAWNPKAVRASAGSIFRLPILAVSAQDCFARLLESGVKIWTTTVKAAQPANLVDLTGPVALLIGNEGNGVSDHLAAQAAGRLTIPCPGPVESLNASVAASVLLYEASRQRFERSGGPTDLRGGPR